MRAFPRPHRPEPAIRRHYWLLLDCPGVPCPTVEDKAFSGLDLPALMVVGGPMEGGCEFDERASDVTSITEGLGMLQAGRLDEETYFQLEDCATPTCGSCSFLGTANTMCCVAEAVGMCLPGSATIPATHAHRLHVAQESGRQIVELFRKGITAREIMPIRRRYHELILRRWYPFSSSWILWTKWMGMRSCFSPKRTS